MEQTTTAAIHHDTHAGGGVKEIWKVTIILSVLTAVELALGFWMMGITNEMERHFIKGAIIILMLAKAFYIVGYFMHLRNEIKNLIMTIVVPLILFVWFIIAFLTDGHSYNNLKNNYSPAYQERSKQQMPKKEEKPESTNPAEK